MALPRLKNHGKGSHILVIGKITTPTDHFLMQGCFLPHQGHPCPDRRTVTRLPDKPNRDARSRTSIAVNQSLIIEAIDDQIHVSVKIEVSHAKTIGNPLTVKTPLLPHRGKVQIASITKGDIGGHQRRIANLFFLRGSIRQPLAPLHDIRIQRIHEVAIDHQQVLPTIQIHIEENRAPGPISGFQARLPGCFGKGSIPTTEQECVATELHRMKILLWQVAWIGVHLDFLDHANTVDSAQHIHCIEIVPTIAIDVGGIKPHGKVAHGTNGSVFDGPKHPAPLVDPDAIGRLEIIAFKNIWKLILIQISNHHAQTEVMRCSIQRFPTGIQKTSFGPWQLNKRAFGRL